MTKTIIPDDSGSYNIHDEVDEIVAALFPAEIAGNQPDRATPRATPKAWVCYNCLRCLRRENAPREVCPYCGARRIGGI